MNFKVALLMSWIAVSSSSVAFASGSFSCAKYTPSERQVVKPESCDDTGGFQLISSAAFNRPELNSIFSGMKESDLDHNMALRDQALEAKFRLTSNMNAARFTFPSGISRVVFRGSYQAPQFSDESVLKQAMGESDQKVSCMKNLVQEYQLAKIVNYDELDWSSAKKLTSEEMKLLSSFNPKAEYWMYNEAFGKTFQYKFNKGVGATPEEKKSDVMNHVANIIHEIEGKSDHPGAVYIHCYGGHHRTGVVYGVLQKCIGRMNVDDVINEYKCHIGYESPEKPGGFHADNETLIREFPCEKYFK